MEKSIVPVNHQIAVRSSTGFEFSNPNRAEVVEIEDDPMEDVERKLEELELIYRFNEKDVPEIFKILINDRISDLKEVNLKCSTCFLAFDDIKIHFKKISDSWTVTYEQMNTTIEVVDPEKSIIDHLWFVLKNPIIKLENFGMTASKKPDIRDSLRIDVKKLEALLQSMIDSIDHQIQITCFVCGRFNENTLIMLLKHVKPEILRKIMFSISWKEEGNYEKMKEIVETEQWKQAKEIFSTGVTPLKIDDFIRFEQLWLNFETITPEDVLFVVKNYLNSEDTKSCHLWCKNNNFNIDAIVDVLRSHINGAEITDIGPTSYLESFRFRIVKSGKIVSLCGKWSSIAIKTH